MDKWVSADRAVELVRSGDRVWVHTGCATPEALLEALVRRSGNLREVEIVHLVPCGDAPYARPEYEGHFRLNSLFLSGCVRESVAAGRADYTPISLSDIENFLEA